MTLSQQFIVKNDCYQNNLRKSDNRYSTFQTRGPLGLMLHSVGCPQPKAQVFADSWNQSGKKPDGSVYPAVHAVLEPGRVIQCMPWNYRGWHGGGDANNTHIGVEMTEPSSIAYSGGASFIDKDPSKTRVHVMATYQTAVELFARLCLLYTLDPLRDGVILSHSEGHKRGIATAHADVEHLWKKFGLTMEQFRRDVKAAMAAQTEETPDPADTDKPADKDKETAQDKEEGDVTQLQFDKLMRSWEEANNPIYNTLNDVPDYWRDEARVLMDAGAIRGDGVNEIGMKHETLRAVIVAGRLAVRDGDS